ncbi:DUF305 domain-containing protein [soil metagenome]
MKIQAFLISFRSGTTAATRSGFAALVAVVALSACASGNTAAPQSGPSHTAAVPAHDAAMLAARADSARFPYTEADIRFMTTMIGHHAQAIVMSNMAPSRAASPSVLTLARRIISSQADEILTMQQWLRDRHQPVPQVAEDGTVSAGGEHAMHGGHNAMDHGDHGLMPGMLTDAQLAQLEAARGETFDRLLLTYMIQHHRGAVSMVEELFNTHGAGQDELVFQFASDVNVDQITEIARMRRMLSALIVEEITQ